MMKIFCSWMPTSKCFYWWVFTIFYWHVFLVVLIRGKYSVWKSDSINYKSLNFHFYRCWTLFLKTVLATILLQITFSLKVENCKTAVKPTINIFSLLIWFIMLVFWLLKLLFATFKWLVLILYKSNLIGFYHYALILYYFTYFIMLYT